MDDRQQAMRLHRASAAMLRWEDAARRLRRGSGRVDHTPTILTRRPDAAPGTRTGDREVT